MDKQSLRKWAKDKRKEINMNAKSNILVNKLMQSSEYINSKKIMIFYPLKNEINLLSLLDDNSKQFYLPRIKGDILECCPYCKDDELSESDFHTKEPICNSCSKSNIDLVVVPALLCDKLNYRLGYGGGFYDKFLTNFNGKSVVCIPSELIIDELPINSYDIRINNVIVA